jgi:2-polyprenyl-3-methyl-5-hydroxy-6-metoxy-1,4-benzoquinol methylase
MPQLRLNRDQFRHRLAGYDATSELAIRDFQAEVGEDATRPAVNAFFQEALGVRRFAQAVDLGCNNGRFALEVLVPRTDRLVLVDFSAKALGAALKRLPSDLVEAALETDLTDDWKHIEARAPFDVVSLCEVIQHMPRADDRVRVFRKAAALLRPNGILLFSTLYSKESEPREGFYRCDRLHQLLYWWRSDEAENAARFDSSGLLVLDRFREARADAFMLERRV